MRKTSVTNLPETAQQTSENLWQPKLLNGCYFDDLKHQFSIEEFDYWPSPQWLTEQLRRRHQNIQIRFVENEAVECDTRYYEQIIFEDNTVPTRRESWHDIFNGLSWSLFPKTKQRLNQQHVEDISNFGLMPRTTRRNHITHFDECGVVLAVAQSSITTLLIEHQWKDAFFTNRTLWGNNVDSEIRPFIFGHANYEMLLSPFLGLTGKWLAISVENDFFSMPLSEQYRLLDTELAHVVDANIFADKGCLKPLPLLGIPGWHSDNCHPSFYDNVSYFRPKR